MPQITTIIPTPNFILIRNRIAEILLDEIRFQGVLSYEEWLQNIEVFAERTLAFDETEIPAINVMLAYGSYATKDMRQSDGEYEYYIDVYTKSPSSRNEGGDSKARKMMDTLFGLVRAILEDPKYKTLGYAPPFNCNVRIKSFEVNEKTKSSFGLQSSPNDSDSLNMGRIIFSVKAPEGNNLPTPNLIDGYQTQVRISDTDLGYQFS